MTRIKEPTIGISEVPDYKSPLSRIVKSLRKAYDNAREKISEKSEQILALQGKLRDTQESRDEWKARTKTAEEEIKKLIRENESLKKRARTSS